MFLALLWLAAAPTSEASLRQIQNARQEAVRAAVGQLDGYVDGHPQDAVAAVERCKLIRATSGSDDDDEPECLQSLMKDHPRSTEVILYRLQTASGEGTWKAARDALADPRFAWTDKTRAAAYALLARGDKGSIAAVDARKAMMLDPSIDLTREIARQLFADGRRSEAIAVASSRPGGDASQTLGKVRLLIEQKSYSRALWLFDTVQERRYVGPMPHAEMLAGAGRLSEAARLYEAQRPYRHDDALGRLIPIYVSLKDQPAALHAYEELRDLGWKHDPLAIRRLLLARQFPGARWHARDLAGLFVLLCAFLGVALLPGLFLVPLHYWSLHRRLRGPPLLDAPRGQRWDFRHVWLACALTAIFQVVFFIPLDQSLFGSWTGLPPVDDVAAAFSGLFAGYVLAAALTVALMLAFRSDRFRLLGFGSWGPGKAAAQIGLTLLVSYAVAFVSFRLVPAAGVPSIEQLIGGFLKAHGFWLTLLSVAVVIPLFEELLFRSLLLELFTRWLGFVWANVLQAIFFATLHGDPRRLVFYFVFGLMLGRLRRKSNGLLPGVIVHAVNNAVVVVALNAAGQLNLLPRKPPAPFVPPEELLACASSDAAKLRLKELKATSSAVALNNLAWQLAIEPGTSSGCLSRAEELMETALTQAPDNPGWLDTKATVLYREGKLDDAIDLESAALSLSKNDATIASQLERFVHKTGEALVLHGAPVQPALILQPGTLTIELNDGMPYGGKLLVRLSGATSPLGFVSLELGTNHGRSYSTPISGLPNDVRAELVFADTRGCDSCKPGSSHSFFAKPDQEVATYP
jgi:uncharacterized protein